MLNKSKTKRLIIKPCVLSQNHVECLFYLKNICCTVLARIIELLQLICLAVVFKRFLRVVSLKLLLQLTLVIPWLISFEFTQWKLLFIHQIIITVIITTITVILIASKNSENSLVMRFNKFFSLLCFVTWIYTMFLLVIHYLIYYKPS